jgi:hypothetical protein
MRAAALVTLALFGTAPFQCGGGNDPNLRREDRAGDALSDLAEDFRKAGDASAEKRTLEALVVKYPSSRHRERACGRLAELGAPPPENCPGGPAPSEKREETRGEAGDGG